MKENAQMTFTRVSDLGMVIMSYITKPMC